MVQNVCESCANPGIYLLISLVKWQFDIDFLTFNFYTHLSNIGYMRRRRGLLQHFRQTELDPQIYWQCNCHTPLYRKHSIPPSNYIFQTCPWVGAHGRKGPTQIFKWEWPQIINFINPLHYHGIKKGDHVCWYEVVSKC